MLKRITFVFACCLGLIGFVNPDDLQAQNNLTIGYVDPQSILNRMPEMKAVEQRLQNFVDRQSQEFQNRQSELQEQVTEYQQKSSVISETARQNEEARLIQLQDSLQQYQTQIQQEIQQKQQELVAPLLQQIEGAINTVADNRGLTYVLNTTTSNGDVIILYASPEAQQYNITDAVMQELDI